MNGILYEICPVCKGEGSVATLKKKIACPLCKPLRVVETGLTIRQVEAALARSKRQDGHDAAYERATKDEPSPEAPAPEGGAA